MTNDITSILTAITRANEALEAQPGYIRKIDELEASFAHRGQHIERLEGEIHALKRTVDELNAELSAVKEDRDQHHFRQLEAEDKAAQAVAVLNSITKSAGDYIVAVTPPPPVEPAPEPVEDKDLTNPTPNVGTEVPSASAQSPTAKEPEPAGQAQNSQSGQDMGESAEDPTGLSTTSGEQSPKSDGKALGESAPNPTPSTPEYKPSAEAFSPEEQAENIPYWLRDPYRK